MTFSRRHILIGCACGIAGAAFPRAGRGADATSETGFICSTPQVTDVVTSEDLDLLFADEPDGLQLLGQGSEEVSIDLYGVAVRAMRWRPADKVFSSSGQLVLGVGFIDGEQWQRDAVKSNVGEWLSNGLPLDLRFDVDKPQIRISFKTNNSAEYGRAATKLRRSQPTMNLVDCSRQATDDAVRAIVLHEFGHATFALGHEHQHPAGGIKWNVEAIMKDTGWTRGQVTSEIIAVFDRTYACRGHKNYDVASIMHYPLRSSWVHSDFSFPKNTHLSAGDIACARSVYEK